MSLLKSLAGETAIYGASNILSRVLQYILLTPYLTYIFSGADKDQYGIHGLMYAFSALLMVLFTFRMETAFFRFANKADHSQSAFRTAALPLALFTFFAVVLVYLLAEPIAGILTKPADHRYVKYFALIIAFDTLAALPFAKLRYENKALHFVKIKIANVVITLVLTIFWLEACPRLINAGYTWFENIYDPSFKLDYVFLANLVASAFTLLFLSPLYVKAKGKFDKGLWKKMLAYAAPLVVVGIAGVINQLSDRYFIKELLPGNLEENLDQLGIYNACIRIAVLMGLFTTAFNYAAEPFFFKNADRKDAKEMYAQVAKAFALVGSMVFLGIMMYLDIIQHLIHSDFRSGLTIVPLVLMAYIFLGLYYNVSIWYKLTDRTIYGALISSMAAVLTIGMNIYLIPRIGIMGAAWTNLATYSFMVTLGYFFGKKYYPVPYDVAKILYYLGAAVITYLASLYLNEQLGESGVPKLVVNTVLLIAHLTIIYFSERKFLSSILHSN